MKISANMAASIVAWTSKQIDCRTLSLLAD
jgi:hypothetical protein